MCATKQSFANTGLTILSKANPNLDGTGVLETVITGQKSGTQINSITIKAQQSTSEGMVRLFIDNGTVKNLYKEISVPAIKRSPVEKAFEIYFDEGLFLKERYTLLASTENAELINIIADGNDWSICNCLDNKCVSIKQYANTGVTKIEEANTELDGSGAMEMIISSNGSPELFGGLLIRNVNIKAIESTSEGIVRLFIGKGDESRKILLTEISIPATTLTALEPAYRTEVLLNFYLMNGLNLYASTEKKNKFNIMAEALDLYNCECKKIEL